MMDEKMKERIKTLFVARSLAQCIYAMPGGECGGPLHIVLDDGNVSDENITFCLKYMEEDECRKEHDLFPIDLCRLCATMLLKLDEHDRARIAEHPYDVNCN